MLPSFQCRSCSGHQGELILDLGLQPLANNLLRAEDLTKEEPSFPLRLAVCHDCWLLQIVDLIPPVTLFSDYLYFSSFSDAMLRHAQEAALRYVAEFSLGKSSHVVEVASNDGYLLKNFVQAGIPCLGIEPAANVAAVAREAGVETRIDFFGAALAQKLIEENRRADLILGNNVFAHAPDTNDFVAGLARLLHPRGRVVLEFPYALDFMEHREFDTIYHEHVFYFSLLALLPLFARHGLEIFHVERLAIHGGSLRLFAGRAGEYPVRDSVAQLLKVETERGLATKLYYRDFSERVADIKKSLLDLLADLKRQGRTIAAYGASAKGSTLLNYVNPPAGTLSFIVDRSTFKQGRFSPGLHLPILPPESLLEQKPDYTLLLTWNFADEILAQQQAYRDAGGRFIIPIPEVRVV